MYSFSVKLSDFIFSCIFYLGFSLFKIHKEAFCKVKMTHSARVFDELQYGCVSYSLILYLRGWDGRIKIWLGRGWV